jgi:hypothetical protein
MGFPAAHPTSRVFGDAPRCLPIRPGGDQMSRAEKYRRHAADCLRFAQSVNAPDDRTMLVEIAATWLRLAERVCSAPPDAEARTEF